MPPFPALKRKEKKIEEKKKEKKRKFLWVNVCGHACMIICKCTITHMWRSKDNSVELVLSFHLYVGSRDQTWLPRCCTKPYLGTISLVHTQLSFGGFWGSNLGPSSFKVSTLPTEPSSCPFASNFLNQQVNLSSLSNSCQGHRNLS